ncbi:MAG: hypothetical protein Q9221_007212 [Calogaya cf. arnoldii]
MKTLSSSEQQELPPSAFSSNSTTAVITLSAFELGAVATKIFSKRCQHPAQELHGASSPAAFGLHVQVPHVTPSGELWYPFFEGKTESELRLSCHYDGLSNGHAMEALLYAELVKAEDMLRLYTRCITDPGREKWQPNKDASSANARPKTYHPETMPTKETTAEQPIHRFFYFRLEQNVRFLQFYQTFIPIGQDLSVTEFLQIPWRINGILYPSLGSLFQIATKLLHPRSPKSISCPTSFGLGDAHGANIMISNNVSRNNSREILYIDYEVAGIHPIMLDLAKPFYNDVFFDVLYMDILPKSPEITCSVEGGLITVNSAPYVGDLTQAIFDIKRRFLLQPLFEISLAHGNDLEKNVPTLSNALLCCATLTRDYSEHPDAFIRNMATGIVLSQAVDLEGFYFGLKLLGLDV